ncbi:Hypothetical protein I5071_35830 [Sandaracinus amylolyticus]|nr:Hypothetical protein I5071_35830 [Sandaracinus amylolyticus]
MPRPDADTDLAHTIGHHLAYETVRRSAASAAHRARRFLDVAGSDAIVLGNSTPRRGTGRSWSPLTAATFDWGVAAIGREWCVIAVFTGED